MSLMKKIMISYLFLFGAYCSHMEAKVEVAPAETKTEWMKFTSEENRFSILLPKKPNHVDQSIDVPKTSLKIRYSTYVSEPSESAVYVVSVWHYPSEIDMSKPEVNLQDGFSGMLSALPGSQVIKKDVQDFNGFKALEFLVKNEDIYFQGRLILVYNTLYQVFTVYKDSEVEAMKTNYQTFIGSFTLFHPEKSKATNGKTL